MTDSMIYAGNIITSIEWQKQNDWNFRKCQKVSLSL